MEIEQNFKTLSLASDDRQTQSSARHTAQRQTEKDEGGLNLGQLFAVVHRRALVIVSTTAAVTSAALIWTLTRTPAYVSKFQLLIEPITAETQVLSSLSEKTLTARQEATAVDYTTQIRVLLSPNLLSPVVSQLQTHYPDINYSSLASNLEVAQPSESKDKKAKILEVTYKNPDPRKVQLVLEQVAARYLKYSLEERQTTTRQGIQFVEDQLPQLRLQVDTLQAKLQKFRQGYNLIEPGPRGDQLSEKINAIEGQKLDTQAKLGEAQSLYASLQKQLKLKPDEAIAASVLSEAPEYQKLLAQLREVESQIAKESVRFTEDNPTVQDLRNQRQKILPLLNREAQRVVGSSSSGTAVNQQKLVHQNSVRIKMTEQLADTASQMQVLKARNQAITQAESRLRQEFEQLPAIARQYDDLEQRLEIAKNNLNQFLAKREALRIDAAQKEIPWELIAPPSEPAASLPSAKRGLALGVLLGLLSGLGAALLIDRFSNVLHTSQEVKEATELPILGTVPLQKKELASIESTAGSTQLEGHIALGSGHQRYNSSPFLEAFRSLYTNIRFLKPDTPIRSLVISSAAPAEGKSTVAVHLAQAAAAMGQRVLLVDADLRCPQVQNLPDLSDAQGLSNVVCTDLAPETAIQQSPYNNNLSVLTAGLIPPDPTELLSSRKMQSLMEHLQKTFDLVIYDSPPLGLADASLLAAHTDGLVMITRVGITNRAVLMQALERLEIPGTPILGVVVTGVKEHTSSYYSNSRLQKAAKKQHKRSQTNNDLQPVKRL